MSRLTKISTFEPDDKRDPSKSSSFSSICTFFKSPNAEFPKCNECVLDNGDICVWMEDKVGISETDHIYLKAKELE